MADYLEICRIKQLLITSGSEYEIFKQKKGPEQMGSE